MANQQARDRAVGALVGLAAGDAVGTTLEFKRPGSFTPIDDMVGGGPFGLRAGQWTDDTSMAMCLAESILDTGTFDPADQLRRYVAWRRHGYWSATGSCFDIGVTTASALTRFERDGSVVDATVDEERAANGSLMRLAAVPIRWSSDVAEAARLSGESSRTTHPASRPVDACRVYGAMIAALISGATLDEVLAEEFWQFGPLDPRVEVVVRGSWRAKEPPAIRGTGYVVDALEAAIWAVAGANDYREAVLRAANLGDDADTTAAIAGQLAGAWWGAAGIPAAWTHKLTDGERIAAIAGRLYDFGVGAQTSLEPVSEIEPWPHDRLTHGYWVESGRILAGEYPASTDPDTSVRKLHVLLDHGMRTFVDLTQLDDRLEPYEDLLAELAGQRGLAVRRLTMPIPDMGVRADEGYDEIVEAIHTATADGGVYVHCWGGIGRTATVVGCLLVDAGMSADEALERIEALRSATRKGHRAAPQAADQFDIVRRRADRRLSGRGAPR
ncbi:MAG: hypothetical protein GX868_12665 [Actinobacteria bacterium]|nr:hypothetical protein [Actinomycetota bacterium]